MDELIGGCSEIGLDKARSIPRFDWSLAPTDKDLVPLCVLAGAVYCMGHSYMHVCSSLNKI